MRNQLVAMSLVALSVMFGPILPAGLSAEGQSRPNILLIVLDATRPDHLGCYAYDLPTSPNIDRLAADGVTFDDAVAQASWTKASFASFLTSRYPFQTGVSDWYTMLPDACVTLQQVLRDNGYRTACVLNLIGQGAADNLFKGFGEISVIKRPERTVHATTERSLALIAGSRRPFFVLAHYYNVHDPYAPSEPYRSLIRRDQLGTGGPSQQDLYDACIREVDAEIQKILDLLAERGLSDDTVVIITADHGEAFGEHGRSGHGWSVYDEEIRVPLILHYPARYPGGQRVKAQVRLVDLVPTVLDIVGLAVPDQCEGLSLLRLVRSTGAGGADTDGRRHTFPTWVAYSSTSMRDRVLPTASLRTARWKLIVEPPTGLLSAFDLKADPGERASLRPSDAAPLDSLLATLRAVPGSNPQGWRFAFIDDSRDTIYEARVTLTGKGRLGGIRKVVNTGTLNIEVSKDAGSMHITAATHDLNLILFDTEPPGAELEVFINPVGEGIPEVHSGVRGRHRAGEVFRTTADSAQGLPQAFEQSRRTRTAGAFIWWMPGEEMLPAPPAATLSPEETKRLKSLGYIH